LNRGKKSLWKRTAEDDTGKKREKKKRMEVLGQTKGMEMGRNLFGKRDRRKKNEGESRLAALTSSETRGGAGKSRIRPGKDRTVLKKADLY